MTMSSFANLASDAKLIQHEIVEQPKNSTPYRGESWEATSRSPFGITWKTKSNQRKSATSQCICLLCIDLCIFLVAVLTRAFEYLNTWKYICWMSLTIIYRLLHINAKIICNWMTEVLLSANNLRHECNEEQFMDVTNILKSVTQVSNRLDFENKNIDPIEVNFYTGRTTQQFNTILEQVTCLLKACNKPKTALVIYFNKVMNRWTTHKISRYSYIPYESKFA